LPFFFKWQGIVHDVFPQATLGGVHHLLPSSPVETEFCSIQFTKLHYITVVPTKSIKYKHFLIDSIPAFTTTLFVMCVACLAGTALMAFKKSRDRLVGYTMLATAERK